MKQSLRDTSNNNDKKKTPKRFIVKRSSERMKESTTCKDQKMNPDNIIIIPNSNTLQIKKKGNHQRNEGNVNIEELGRMNEEDNLCQLITQKKRVAKHQRDVIKKERELSNKLRLAISKLNKKTSDN
jgi:hypothetical protein